MAFHKLWFCLFKHIERVQRYFQNGGWKGHFGKGKLAEAVDVCRWTLLFWQERHSRHHALMSLSCEATRNVAELVLMSRELQGVRGSAGSETPCDAGFLGQASCALLLRLRPRCCRDWIEEEPQWSLKMSCRYGVWFLQLGVWRFLVDRLLWQRWRQCMTMHLPPHSGLVLCAWLLLRTVRRNPAAWTPLVSTCWCRS